jgi:hypothetical protein
MAAPFCCSSSPVNAPDYEPTRQGRDVFDTKTYAARAFSDGVAVWEPTRVTRCF